MNIKINVRYFFLNTILFLFITGFQNINAQTQAGCTVTFPNNFDNQVNLSSIYNPASCPSGDLVLANLNDKNGASTVIFDSNITLNSLTLDYKSGNNPLEIIIPVGVTVTIVDFVDMNLSSAVQDKFLTVGGTLDVGGNIDFGNINLEIDGSGGTINAGSITGAGATTCGADTDCPTFNVPGSCAPAGSGLCTESALPIELLSFEAYEFSGKILLNWSTASEQNNDYFTIERSNDGLNYKGIAKVAGAGTSAAALQYSFIDRNPLFGKSYYRLKQTDFDGVSETFAPVAVEFTSLTSGDLKFNNPVKRGDQVTIFTNADDEELLTVSVYNMTGEQIVNKKFTGVNYSFDLNADVKPGMYFIKVSSISSEKTGRLIVQ